MELSEKVENIGGSGAAVAGFGGIGLFMMAIFLVILFAAFRRHGDEFGHHQEGCADKLTWARYANFEDPAINKMHHDQAVDTGRIRCEINKQTGELLLNQEKTTNHILQNQNVIAREQERFFYQSQLDQKNERIADARECAVMLEGRRRTGPRSRPPAGGTFRRHERPVLHSEQPRHGH